MIHSTAKAKEVNIVERSIADAVGLGLDVKETKGVLIVNFGGETTELSVLAEGGMVLNRLLKLGGTAYDQAIVNLVRHSHDFLIGHIENYRRNRNAHLFVGYGIHGDAGILKVLRNGLPSADGADLVVDKKTDGGNGLAGSQNIGAAAPGDKAYENHHSKVDRQIRGEKTGQLLVQAATAPFDRRA